MLAHNPPHLDTVLAILTRIKELLCGANAISDRFIAKLAVVHGESQSLCVLLAGYYLSDCRGEWGVLWYMAGGAGCEERVFAAELRGCWLLAINMQPISRRARHETRALR